MNLLLRFETASGPRTVIACSVPRSVAAEVAAVMHNAGQHAEFVDRCSPLSIADRLLIKQISEAPRTQDADSVLSLDWGRKLKPKKASSRKTARGAEKAA
jgi:hypothetical protein